MTDLAASIWAALSTGDAAFADFLAPNMTLRPSGRSAWAGEFHGRDNVLAYLEANATSFPDLSLDLRDTLVSESRIAYVLHMHVARDGHVVDDDSTWIVTISDGQIVEWELNDNDQYAMDQFWNTFPDLEPPAT